MAQRPELTPEPQQPRLPLTALLIGSYKFAGPRPVRGAPRADSEKLSTQLHQKGGQKKARAKRGGYIQEYEWVEGDLNNMETYVQRMGIHVFFKLDYREHNDVTGEYADGKNDILDKIREFFRQDDRTKFVLYFSGHGNTDGSWCIPVTEKRDPNTANAAAENGRSTGDPVAGPAITTQNVLQETRPSTAGTGASVGPASAAASAVTAAGKPGGKPAGKPKLDPTDLFYDLVTYDDVIDIWDATAKKGSNRKLMMILDCCHSGRWVQMVNGECRRIKTYPTAAAPGGGGGETTAVVASGGEAEGGVGGGGGEIAAVPRADAEATRAVVASGGAAVGVGGGGEIEGEITRREDDDVVAPAEEGGGGEIEGEITQREDDDVVASAEEGGDGGIEGEITRREGGDGTGNKDEGEDRPNFYKKRNDVCIQAACRPVEESIIASNQLSSFFTRAFIAAQSKTTFEKLCITFFDHLFVFNFPSFLCSPIRNPFTPMKSVQPPFADIKFFDSFDDMHLVTP